MKKLNFAVASLSVLALAGAAIAPAAHAQGMPMSPDSTPMHHMSMNAKYEASWIYRNLSGKDVWRLHNLGYDDSTIKGAANIAMRVNLDLDYVLRQVKEVGTPLTNIALDYGLPMRIIDKDIPGYGWDGHMMMMAPPMGAPMTPTTTMAPPVTPPAGGASSNELPPPPAAVTTPAAPLAATAAQGSVVDVVMGNPDLSTLVTALKAADLVDTLSGPGPFTIFAPTNAAFAKLPAGTVDELLKPENKDKLRSVLTYHVVPGKVMASDILSMSNPSAPKSLNGATINVKTTAPVMVNDADVTQTDIVASNGVIHVIDSVLMPPAP